MYTILGPGSFLRGTAYLSAVAAVAIFLLHHFLFGTMPSNAAGLLGAILSSAGSGAAVVAALISIGETAIFPWLCRWTWLGRVFPHIEGEWTGAINSNIALIAERDVGLQGKVKTDLIQAKIVIKARLLSIHLGLRSRPLNSDAPYHVSETLIVGVARNKADHLLTMTYVFQGTTRNPLETDTDGLLGAARLELSREGDQQVLDGVYWSNRNWKQARNTAGTVRFVRPDPAR